MLRVLTLPRCVWCDTTLLQILDTCRAPMIWALPTRKANSIMFHSSLLHPECELGQIHYRSPLPSAATAPTSPDLSSVSVPHGCCPQHATHTALHGIGENQGHERPCVRSEMSGPAICPQQGLRLPAPCHHSPTAQSLHCHEIALTCHCIS